jgi:predicted nucleotidyltransferase
VLLVRLPEDGDGVRLSETTLAEIVDAIRSVYEPAAVILFGSQARGDVHARSDVDVLVIRNEEFRTGESRRREIGQLYRAVSRKCDIPKDILLFTRREFEDWRNTTNHAAAQAFQEGRVLYGQV